MKLLKAGAESCGKYTNGEVMGSRDGEREAAVSPTHPSHSFVPLENL